MKPEDVPDDLVILLAECIRSGHTPRAALSLVLTRYDEMYSEKLNAFYQMRWNAGLEVMADSPAAPAPAKERPSVVKPDGVKKRRRVKITFPGDPPVVKIYKTAREAAVAQFVGITTMRGRLNGMYTKRRKVDDPIYEWIE